MTSVNASHNHFDVTYSGKSAIGASCPFEALLKSALGHPLLKTLDMSNNYSHHYITMPTNALGAGYAHAETGASWDSNHRYITDHGFDSSLGGPAWYLPADVVQMDITTPKQNDLCQARTLQGPLDLGSRQRRLQALRKKFGEPPRQHEAFIFTQEFMPEISNSRQAHFRQKDVKLCQSLVEPGRSELCSIAFQKYASVPFLQSAVASCNQGAVPALSDANLIEGDAVLVNLRGNTTLVSANLLNNNIRIEQEHIVTVLKEHPTLKSLCGNKGDETELDMSGKDMGVDGAIMLAPEIVANGALTSLNLSSNNLKAEGAEIVAKAIKASVRFRSF
jgi:hypothetical protein